LFVVRPFPSNCFIHDGIVEMGYFLVASLVRAYTQKGSLRIERKCKLLSTSDVRFLNASMALHLNNMRRFYDNREVAALFVGPLKLREKLLSL